MLHVRVVLISTSVIPASIIFSAKPSVIYCNLSAITSLVVGLIIFLLVYLPTIRSYSFSITSPVLSLINAFTTTPFSVPQSSSLTIIS